MTWNQETCFLCKCCIINLIRFKLFKIRSNQSRFGLVDFYALKHWTKMDSYLSKKYSNETTRSRFNSYLAIESVEIFTFFRKNLKQGEIIILNNVKVKTFGIHTKLFIDYFFKIFIILTYCQIFYLWWNKCDGCKWKIFLLYSCDAAIFYTMNSIKILLEQKIILDRCKNIWWKYFSAYCNTYVRNFVKNFPSRKD